MRVRAGAKALSLADLKSAPKLQGAVLFSGVAAATLPDAIFPAAIVVESGKIADVGPDAEVKKRWRGRARIVDAAGFTVIPGLINAHTHAAMSFFRDRAHGQKEMIERFFFPTEKKLSAELIEPLCYSYLYAGLRSGTTAFVDHYYFAESVAKALDRFRLRGAVGETVADQGGPFPKERTWSMARDSIANWRFGTRIVPVVAPHAADTVSEKLLGEMAGYARANGLPLHMHLAQTQGEVERVRRECELSPVEKASRAGALGPRSLVVHMIAATANDIKLVERESATICLSPASQILYEKLAPLGLFLESGVSLALGTDSAAANDGSDLFQEMRLTALLLRDRSGDSRSNHAREVFRMCTEVPGKIFFNGQTGALRTGLDADLVFIKHELGNSPVADLFTNLIFSMGSAQVEHVLVSGEWRLWSRSLPDLSVERLSQAYEKAVRAILQRAQLPKEHAPLAIQILP